MSQEFVVVFFLAVEEKASLYADFLISLIFMETNLLRCFVLHVYRHQEKQSEIMRFQLSLRNRLEALPPIPLDLESF